MGKIYTKTGDQGQTYLISGERLPKSHIRLHTYGTIDELNSSIGFAISQALLQSSGSQFQEMLKETLYHIQNDLFNMGSQLACLKEGLQKKLPSIHEADITRMESKIDELDGILPPLKKFILPGGTSSASAFHMARTICRRAERDSIALNLESPIDPLILQYLNRLSDLLFMISRFCNSLENRAEIEWDKSVSK